MSKTAIIALLAEMNDADGMIFARIRDEMPAALRDTEVLPPAVVRTALHLADAAALFAIAGNLRVPRGAIAELYNGPALAALRALRALAPKNPRAYTEATRGIGESMDRHLGGSAAAWGRLLALLPTYEGPLHAAIEAAGTGDEDLGLSVPGELRMEFRQLWLLAPPASVARLLPALRPHIVRDLVRFGAEVPPAVLADVIARATPAQRRSLARARRALPEVGAALIGLGDPALNALVYLNAHTGEALRARIMASPTPLHPTLVERLCTNWSVPTRLPALWSGDPLLVRAAMLKRHTMTITLAESLATWQDKGIEGLRPHARHEMQMPAGLEPRPFRVPRYRLLLLITLSRLCECAGPQAALDLLDEVTVPESEARRYRELLSSPAGIARLRAEIDASSGTRRLVRRLRAHPPRFGWPMLETPVVDWAEIIRAHRRKPFPNGSLALLAKQDGCPIELRREVGSAPAGGRWPTPIGWLDPMAGRGLSEHERAMAADVTAGRTPIGELLTGPRAASAGELLALRDTIAPDGRAASELRDSLQELIERRVAPADRVAFAVVALRLLPEFEGSVAQLVDTAAAAACG
ncbi:hypothetical protein [Embleya scabrispora]|uniref:hypothetical protein n=1 Tax=Embleya scabrispora TaxID=159449 RepID=UPI00035C88C9|nr:hypothetical protein [Embleya scabrispora]MYS84590.1 hypothetical protein [Streptomyces sp. SID5474]